MGRGEGRSSEKKWVFTYVLSSTPTAMQPSIEDMHVTFSLNLLTETSDTIQDCGSHCVGRSSNIHQNCILHKILDMILNLGDKSMSKCTTTWPISVSYLRTMSREIFESVEEYKGHYLDFQSDSHRRKPFVLLS